MDESEALERFATGDEQRARDAFGPLCAFSRPFLHAFLGRMGCRDRDKQEDVLQETFLKAWQYRARFQNHGVGAWRGLLKTTASRCFIDQIRTEGGALSLDEIERFAVPPGERGDLEDSVAALSIAIASDELRPLVDAALLGFDPDLPVRERDRRVLAAQLVYEENCSWEEAIRLLQAAAPPGEPLLGRATLDAWLSDGPTLRALAFGRLHYSSDALATHLLSLAGTSPSELDDLMRRAFADLAGGDRSVGEIVVLFWRFRLGLPADKILQRDDCPFSANELSAVLERWTALFPFKQQMSDLLQRLTRARVRSAKPALADRGLWQRLAWEYRYADDLPHADIQARITPAAEQVGVDLTLAMLNGWLSSHRLLGRVAQLCRERQKEGFDDA